MFYFVAWRLCEIVNAPSVRAFPKMRKLNAKGIRDVRNLLIEHPEDGKPCANFSQTLVVTDHGPILKTTEFRVSGVTQRSSATSTSLDRGLYINAGYEQNSRLS
jgi:hypothetical protein